MSIKITSGNEALASAMPKDPFTAVSSYLPCVIKISASGAKAYPFACVDAKPCLPVVATRHFEKDNLAVPQVDEPAFSTSQVCDGITLV